MKIRFFFFFLPTLADSQSFTFVEQNNASFSIKSVIFFMPKEQYLKIVKGACKANSPSVRLPDIFNFWHQAERYLDKVYIGAINFLSVSST